MSATTRQLYEQAKRVLRGSLDPDIAGDGRFVLACRDCGLAFQEHAEMGMVALHMEIAHEWDPDGDERFELDLVWIGKGPAPKARR